VSGDARAIGIPAAVLDRLGQAVARADADADDFYSRIAEAVCDLGPMRTAIVLRHDELRGRLTPVGAHGPDAENATEAPWWPPAASAQAALADGGVLEVDGDRDAGARAVCTPMAAAGPAVGVIVSDRGSGAAPLSCADRALLALIGRAAALAASARIATARRDQLRRATERVELGRELHDRVIQRLFGVSLALGAAGVVEDATRRRCVDEVQAALADLRAALARPARDAARPAAGATLRELAERLAAGHPQLAIVLDWPTEVRIPGALEAPLQSILSELVRNVAKHATPTRTDVRVARAGATLELSVINDGAPAVPAHPGAGLRLAAFDALRAGGLLQLGPHDGGRWQVRVLVPVGEDG
jgi:signal transduction histidine kinase